MDYLVRAPTAADLNIVADKVTGCFEGAARQTGCKVKVDREVLMFELRNDKALAVSQFLSLMLGAGNGEGSGARGIWRDVEGQSLIGWSSTAR